ncbi:MAG: hypothetical protein HC779_01255 [Phyllobacteriaceae bacterium]|nr:hypothetical protein [Phyllobacteriaceae bacterium]
MVGGIDGRLLRRQELRKRGVIRRRNRGLIEIITAQRRVAAGGPEVGPQRDQVAEAGLERL